MYNFLYKLIAKNKEWKRICKVTSVDCCFIFIVLYRKEEEASSKQQQKQQQRQMHEQQQCNANMADSSEKFYIDQLIYKYTSQQGAAALRGPMQDSHQAATNNAEEVLKKYTEDTGMGLDDIITRYSKHAEAIKAGSAGGLIVVQSRN